jgi:D-alanyl-D-alanine dipeptidase
LLVSSVIASATSTPPPQEFRRTISELARARQLIVVQTDEWKSIHGECELFERSGNTHWSHPFDRFKVVVGRSGLAWGIGLHGTASDAARLKHEGDGCSPAGVFSIECIYGFAPASLAHELRFPYSELTEQFEGIHDPKSRYYNRLVNTSRVQKKDWSSSEKVRLTNESFRWCINVKHNWKPYPGFGSCIYLHIWRGENVPTVGCTAMSQPSIEKLVRWLDAAKSPLLVQLPREEYSRLRNQWQLPND